MASLVPQGPAAWGESSPPASIQLPPPPSTHGAAGPRDSTRLGTGNSQQVLQPSGELLNIYTNSTQKKNQGLCEFTRGLFEQAGGGTRSKEIGATSERSDQIGG